jgi:DNA-binding GntR family transcriptional regulator
MPVPTPARPVIPRRLQKDAVFEYLVAAILDGTLRPGERLRDADCETWLGVSRTPIRVAIAKLEQVRLAEISARRATSVVVPRREVAVDLLAVGCALLAAVVASAGHDERTGLDRRLSGLVDDCRARSSSADGSVEEVDAVGDSWAAVWSAVDDNVFGRLAVRHARRLTLPLRHHLRELSADDLDVVADVFVEVRRSLGGGLVDAAAEACERVTSRLDLPDVARDGASDPRGASAVVEGRRVLPRGDDVARAGARATLVRPRLSDDVYRMILVAILDGTLTPGERLADDELTTWLGVSRTPVRSALERLDERGLVDMAPNRYTRVARPELADVVAARDLYARLVSWSADRHPAGGSADRAEIAAVTSRLLPLATRSEGAPATLTTLTCLGTAVRRLASVERSPALSRELDILEPRLAHGVISCGFGLPPSSWRTFSDAVRVPPGATGGGWGPATAALIRSLSPQGG